MEKSLEVQYCTGLLLSLGSQERLHLLKSSNLTLEERKIISMRYVVGLTAKEVAFKIGLTDDGFRRMQRRIFKKLYLWLKITGKNEPLSEEVLEFLQKEKD
ncbi:MAG: hypothetical protein KBT03_03250 [Bacteroidales bacterium]|nr:hypothetical protein [Candidatus Scybalousia scybalohippi]